jgi:hypothetical protein
MLHAPDLFPLLPRGRRRLLEAFGFGFVFLRARANGVGSVRDGGMVGDGLGLFGRRFSNGVSIRMSRNNVCIGMLGDFGIKGVCRRTLFALAGFAA